MNLLFGFSGRIGRLQWWLGQLAIFGVAIVFIGILTAIATYGQLDHHPAGGGLSNAGGSVVAVLICMSVLITWINLATTVKRFHDRDKSGFWFLINFIPFIGPVWILVECGMLSGSPGGNDYGPSSGTGSYDAAAGLDVGALHGLPERHTSQPVAQARSAAPVQHRTRPTGPAKFGRRGA